MSGPARPVGWPVAVLCDMDGLLIDSEPIWTFAEITPPAKFVHDYEGRRGSAVNSLVSGDCIVSAEPNAMYIEPSIDGTRWWGESGASVVQNEGCRPTPAANREPWVPPMVHTTDRAPMQ